MAWLTPTLQAVLVTVTATFGLFALLLAWVVWRYLNVLIRIFEEKPLFIAPQGEPATGAQTVRFPCADGLMLTGSYMLTTAATRRGVVLFGPEFGSNRWSCAAYCAHLVNAGYDLFTFDFRSHGESDTDPNYQPLMWVTNREECDMLAAISYLQSRPDADPRGIGIFGVSRGGGAALLAAAKSPSVRCVVTDGAFATRTTMIPYMRKWIDLYCSRWRLQRFLPNWFFGLIAHICLWFMSRRRGCRFPSLQRAIARISPRPLLMIHGAQDTYIKPVMAQRLFQEAAEPKKLWLVPLAKHNQAVQVAGKEYEQRVTEFFDKYLASIPVPAAVARDAVLSIVAAKR